MRGYGNLHIKLGLKWFGNLYIKLGLPLVSQLEEQQGQIVETHQAEEKMIVKKKRDGCILNCQLTYRGTRKRIGRGRCIVAFDAAPSVFERELVRMLWQKRSKINMWWQELYTWHRRTTRRQLGRARVRGWSGLGRGGYVARKLGVAFLEEYNVRISSWIAYDRHAQ